MADDENLSAEGTWDETKGKVKEALGEAKEQISQEPAESADESDLP